MERKALSKTGFFRGCESHEAVCGFVCYILTPKNGTYPIRLFTASRQIDIVQSSTPK